MSSYPDGLTIAQLNYQDALLDDCERDAKEDPSPETCTGCLEGDCCDTCGPCLKVHCQSDVKAHPCSECGKDFIAMFADVRVCDGCNPGHRSGCICADCSGAELDSGND